MADAIPNRPYTPKFRILDANAGPVTSGVTGTISLYGPASTTALVSGSTLVHQGDGYWGASFAATNLGTLGTYRWVTSALTGGVTWSAQAGSFLVAPSDELTLREVYTRVRRGLRDGWTGTTDATGSTTTLKASAFAYGSSNDWVSSEVFFFEPGTATDTNPVRVTAFSTTGGTFTVTPAITSTVAGQDFIIGNKDGQGYTHDEVMDAIRGACRRRRVPRKVVDQVLTSTTWGTFEYAAPSGWTAVDMVEYQPAAGYATDWQYIDRTLTPFNPTTGILTLRLTPPNNALRLTGRVLPSLPALMTDLVPGDGTQVADDAIYELLRMSADNADRQRAAMMAPAVERARAGAALARL